MQHPTDGTPIKDTAPVNNDNDGKTKAPGDTGETAADKLRKMGNWNPELNNAPGNNQKPEEIKNKPELSGQEKELIDNLNASGGSENVVLTEDPDTDTGEKFSGSKENDSGPLPGDGLHGNSRPTEF